jgi:hypothetical protein
MEELIILIDDDGEFLLQLLHDLRSEQIGTDVKHFVGTEVSFQEMETFCENNRPSVVITSSDWGEDGEEGLTFVQSIIGSFPVILLVDEDINLEFLHATLSEANLFSVMFRNDPKLIPTIKTYLGVVSLCGEDSPVN